MLALVGSILYLAVLECVLSVDNALALAALVHGKLKDPKDRVHALRWGIVGAYVIRFAVIGAGVWLLAHWWVKAIAGTYLIWMSIKELIFGESAESGDKEYRPSTLWRTIVAVEVMDLMFSVDSIAVTLGVSQKFWALAGGAILGIAMMRFAATQVIKLMDKWPWLAKVAFVLVGLAGVKIFLELYGVI